MLKPMFSTRSDLNRSSNAFTQAWDRALGQGALLYDLTSSNPTALGLHHDLARVAKALSEAAARPYRPESLGYPAAREAIGQEFDADPEHVIVTASTSEAYSLLFKLLANPGDALFAPRPSYPLFEHLARFEGLSLRNYRHFYDGEWSLDLQSLHAAHAEPCRAIITVSPNNPTGAYVREGEFQHLMKLGLPIVVDEVFWPFSVEEDSPPSPVARLAQEGLVFSLGGLSKYAGLPQLKLGWIILSGAPEKIEEARGRLELLSDAYLSANGPTQEACSEIFSVAHPFRDNARARLRGNMARLRRGLSASVSMSCPKVEGGWYACLRVPAIQSSEAWAIEMLGAGVAVHPGHFYDFDEEGYLVLSLLTKPQIFQRGLDRLIEIVDARTTCSSLNPVVPGSR